MEFDSLQSKSSSSANNDVMSKVQSGESNEVLNTTTEASNHKLIPTIDPPSGATGSSIGETSNDDKSNVDTSEANEVKSNGTMNSNETINSSLSDNPKRSTLANVLNHPYPSKLPSVSNMADQTPQDKFHCRICHQGFTRKHNMISHELIHSKLKPHTCSVCNATFRRIHDLKRHEKLHTGEKPYQCDKCHRKFSRPDSLTRHQNSPNACLAKINDSTGNSTSVVLKQESDDSSQLRSSITPIQGSSNLSLNHLTPPVSNQQLGVNYYPPQPQSQSQLQPSLQPQFTNHSNNNQRLVQTNVPHYNQNPYGFDGYGSNVPRPYISKQTELPPLRHMNDYPEKNNGIRHNSYEQRNKEDGQVVTTVTTTTTRRHPNDYDIDAEDKRRDLNNDDERDHDMKHQEAVDHSNSKRSHEDDQGKRSRRRHNNSPIEVNQGSQGSQGSQVNHHNHHNKHNRHNINFKGDKLTAKNLVKSNDDKPRISENSTSDNQQSQASDDYNFQGDPKFLFNQPRNSSLYQYQNDEYITLSRYQDLMAYTQSLEDSLGKLNSRIQLLEDESADNRIERERHKQMSLEKHKRKRQKKMEMSRSEDKNVDIS